MIRFIVSAILLIFISTPGQAQSVLQCNERERMILELFKKFQEEPERAGVLPNGNLLESLASPSGSFTILVTRPDGILCIFATGEGWSSPVRKPPVQPGEGS